MHLQSAKWTRRRVIMEREKKDNIYWPEKPISGVGGKYGLACFICASLAPLQATPVPCLKPNSQTCSFALCECVCVLVSPFQLPPLPIPHLPTLATINPCVPKQHCSNNSAC